MIESIWQTLSAPHVRNCSCLVSRFITTSGLSKMTRSLAALISIILASGVIFAKSDDGGSKFDHEKDLISLHYDHAPDKDDGHSTAADRTILESMFGAEWLSNHAVAVSGTYGLNKNKFNTESDAVMDATWNERGGWIPADRDWSAAVEIVFKRWIATLQAGGDVFVKEGGQSDFTAELVRRLRERHPDIDTQMRIHVVQHSDWNENMTSPKELTYTRANTNYIRIRDANRYLRRKGAVESFETAATQHPLFAQAWRSAFHYFSPAELLDFSDTGELMHILGLGEMGIDEFRIRFLDAK